MNKQEILEALELLRRKLSIIRTFSEDTSDAGSGIVNTIHGDMSIETENSPNYSRKAISDSENIIDRLIEGL